VAETSSSRVETTDRHRIPAPGVSPRRAGISIVFKAVVVVAAAAGPVEAQGVTGAAIDGRIFGEDGTPLELAVVEVVNTTNGERWRAKTGARGRYFLEYLSVGGPYRIEVRAIGYQPAQRGSVHLSLGQRLTADFKLTPAIVQLEEISVTGVADPRLSAARTGPALIISDSLIARLPSIGRDYTDLALLSPQVSRSPNGGLSFAGQHDRYNSLQIDGTSNNDLLRGDGSGNGTLGMTQGLTSLAPEAVEELQVESAPFDVRYGNFAGGLINAVTKSGTNQVAGSIRGYFESSDLVAADSTGSRGDEFSRRELGFTYGAPIVRDRVALFLDAGMQRYVTPQTVPAPSRDTTGGADSAGVGIRYQSLVRFDSLLRHHGVDPGSFTAGVNRTAARNLFVKVTAQLGVNSRLAVSHTYGHGENQDGTLARSRGYYPLSSAGVQAPETINATRLAWTTAFGNRFSNELMLARVDDRRTCTPNSDFPSVSVQADSGGLVAGMAGGCTGSETGQRVWELTDNFGLAAGDHRLTVGTHGELIDLVDDVVGTPGGAWSFGTLDSLAHGQANGYTRDFPIGGSQVAFRVNQIGAYVQDQWVPTPRLTLTGGVRFDVPFLPTPPTQNRLVLRELRVNTALTPSGNLLWSPRLGVNYDLTGRGTARLRGGVGLFEGPPAYQWFQVVYARTGTRAHAIDCKGRGVPAFTVDPARQPTECADTAQPAFARLAYFDPEFRFPQNLKLAIGADLLFPAGLVGTFDLLYSRGVNTFEVVDVSLNGPVGVAAGEGGRTMYGTVDSATGASSPLRKTTDALEAVFENRNGNGGDRSYSVSVQLGKHFGNGVELSAAYTFTDAVDRGSSSQDLPGPSISSSPLNGTLEHPELRTSFWEERHKVTLVGTTDLPFGFHLGLTYVGGSNTPFTYLVAGDANADGFWPSSDPANDAVYVPRDAADITLRNPKQYARLDQLIRAVPCLRTQRGHLLKRNSCQDPWLHQTQARVAKRFRLSSAQELELTVDLLNVLNFLDSDWGLVRHTLGTTLLSLEGYDTEHGRGVYDVDLGATGREVDVGASRWRMQLGATLTF